MDGDNRTAMALNDFIRRNRVIFDPDGVGAGRVVLDSAEPDIGELSADPDYRRIDFDVDVDEISGQVTVNTTRLAADPSRIADLFTSHDGNDVIVGFMYLKGATDHGHDLPDANMINYVDVPLPDQGDQSTNRETLRFQSTSMVDLADSSRVWKRGKTV